MKESLRGISGKAWVSASKEFRRPKLKKIKTATVAEAGALGRVGKANVGSLNAREHTKHTPDGIQGTGVAPGRLKGGKTVGENMTSRELLKQQIKEVCGQSLEEDFRSDYRRALAVYNKQKDEKDDKEEAGKKGTLMESEIGSKFVRHAERIGKRDFGVEKEKRLHAKFVKNIQQAKAGKDVREDDVDEAPTGMLSGKDTTMTHEVDFHGKGLPPAGDRTSAKKRRFWKAEPGYMGEKGGLEELSPERKMIVSKSLSEQPGVGFVFPHNAPDPRAGLPKGKPKIKKRVKVMEKDDLDEKTYSPDSPLLKTRLKAGEIGFKAGQAIKGLRRPPKPVSAKGIGLPSATVTVTKDAPTKGKDFRIGKGAALAGAGITGAVAYKKAKELLAKRKAKKAKISEAHGVRRIDPAMLKDRNAPIDNQGTRIAVTGASGSTATTGDERRTLAADRRSIEMTPKPSMGKGNQYVKEADLSEYRPAAGAARSGEVMMQRYNPQARGSGVDYRKKAKFFRKTGPVADSVHKRVIGRQLAERLKRDYDLKPGGLTKAIDEVLNGVDFSMLEGLKEREVKEAHYELVSTLYPRVEAVIKGEPIEEDADREILAIAVRELMENFNVSKDVALRSIGKVEEDLSHIEDINEYIDMLVAEASVNLDEAMFESANAGGVNRSRIVDLLSKHGLSPEDALSFGYARLLNLGFSPFDIIELKTKWDWRGTKKPKGE